MTGICPFNPNEVLARLPDKVDNGVVKDTIDKSVIALLKEMRYGSINIIDPKNKKKIKVVSVIYKLRPQEDVETNTEPVIKKKRNQKNYDRNQCTNSKDLNCKEQVSVKGKGIYNNKKENELLSPVAHCSNSFDNINEIELSSHDQPNEWRDIDVEKMPMVLWEDLQLYEEIILPFEDKDFKAKSSKEGTDAIEIPNTVLFNYHKHI